MIVDKLQNAALYSGLSDRLVKALEFLRKTDLVNLDTGKHPIEGDDIFAIVSEYETRLAEECRLEAHKRYIDVQYIITGSEQMGYLPWNNQEPTYAYDEEKDIMFFKADTSLVTVKEGMFAIFFPGDLHKPCIRSNGTSRVKKVVVKVRA